MNIEILDKNERLLSHIGGPPITDGAVQYDASADITRSLSLTCLDPDHKLTFDSNSPAQGAVYADNFIYVEYGVYLPVHKSWVDVPVFKGPCTLFERQGAVVTIEAQGKESLAQDPHLVMNGYTIRQGTTVAHAIRNVMDRIGETRYSLGMIKGKLAHHRAVTPQEAPWKVLVGGDTDAKGHPKPGLMTKAHGHQYLFFNGRGILTAKNRHSKSRWQFRDLTTLPGFTYDVLDVRNTVEVTGGTPKHSKKHFRGSATLPASHPLSAQALSRNGHGRHMVTFFQSDSLKSDKACNEKAKQILNASASQGIDATFECLPIPHIEELDPVSLVTDEYHLPFILKTATLPLTSGSAMSIGFHKGVKPRRRNHKKHHRHHHHHHKGKH